MSQSQKTRSESIRRRWENPSFREQMVAAQTHDVWQRFYSKVEKSSGCWIWTGAQNNQGYGQFYFEGRTQLAHRVHYQLKRGDVSGELVLHECDTKLCVRLGHLKLGSKSDNAMDYWHRGRLRNVRDGTQAPVRKTTEEPARHGNPFRQPLTLPAPMFPVSVPIKQPTQPLVPA
jgi:hypothetical protein